MGKDGTDFWTEDIMKQIVIYDDAGNAIGHKNFDLRLAKTKEQALIFKEAVDLLKLSHRQFYLAKGVKPGEYLTTEPILDEEMVDSFINKFQHCVEVLLIVCLNTHDENRLSVRFTCEIPSGLFTIFRESNAHSING